MPCSQIEFLFNLLHALQVPGYDACSGLFDLVVIGELCVAQAGGGDARPDTQ